MLMTAKPQATALKAKLFRGFSDPSRLSILEVLRRGSLTVTDIAEGTGLSQSNVSNHLGCLRWCGLVQARREGKQVYYRVADPRIRDLLALGDAILREHAAGIASCDVLG